MLAIDGLCDPPPPAGGEWDAADLRAFRRAAAAMNAVVNAADGYDDTSWQWMSAALIAARLHVVQRDGMHWPAGGYFSPNEVDFTLPTLWGVECMIRRLKGCDDARSQRLQVAASAVVAAASMALAKAQNDGPPACTDRRTTLRLQALATLRLQDLAEAVVSMAPPAAKRRTRPPRHPDPKPSRADVRRQWHARAAAARGA
jgi:hypothetical protein